MIDGMQVAKGSTLRATLDWLSATCGAEACDAVLARLSEDDRHLVRTATATEEYPFGLWRRLSEATESEVGASHPDWPERAGAHAIDSYGVQLYGGILRKSSPLEFLTQSVSLFRLYYQPGDMKVVEVEASGETSARAVLRLIGFEHESRWFCRRQTGGLERATTIAGGERARVHHVRCTLDGDAFCEWELRWERPKSAS